MLNFLLLCIVFFTIPLVVLKYGKEWLIALLPVYLLVANIFAESFVFIFGLMTSLAVPVYAAIFLITDLLSEHYSKNDAQRAVLVGLLGQICFFIVLGIVTHSEIAPEQLQKYSNVFSVLPRLIAGSFVAYLVSQFLDIRIFHVIRSFTGDDRHVWLRNNGSTMISQFVDTIIFLCIAFYGTHLFPDFRTLLPFILTTWLIKVTVAALDTPYIYLSRAIYKKRRV